MKTKFGGSSFFSWEDGGTFPKINLPMTYRSYIVKEYDIGSVVTEILLYRLTDTYKDIILLPYKD